jgi:formate dehydrogenase iron-sulfur subunit
MVTGPGLTVRRQSASPTSSTAIRTETVVVSKLVDIDLCIGCKACEVACKTWNDLAVDETSGFASYQSHPDLTANTWDLMRFNEVDLDDGGLAWLIKKDSCLHCEEPGCLEACPAPGAIVQYENGIVDFNQDNCIGCQYCVAGCPFDIPRFDEETKKVYKCTMCVDRVSAGLEPACVKSCPTGSIRFGTKEDMVAYGEAKVAKLVDRGFDDAMLYDPEGVGGLHMMYVVPRGDMLDGYDLPEDPQVPGTYLGSLRALRALGTVSMWAGLLGVGLFFLRVGRRRPPPEDVAVRNAYAIQGDEPRDDENGTRDDDRPSDGSSGAGSERPPIAGGSTDMAERPGGEGDAPAGTSDDHGDARSGGAVRPAGEGEIRRYSLFERVVHWGTTLAFLYLLLSGFALGYPRLAWLYDVLGGGQTVRWMHPVAGVVVTIGALAMFVLWARDMLFTRTDRAWLRRLPTYAKEGHVDVDVGRYNAGQKGYFWWAVLTIVLLLLTGIPLWFPDEFTLGLLRFARVSHHVLFLLAFAGLIIHAYMSTAMFPGTMSAMTSGYVTRRWAAFHHPAWFRRKDRGDTDETADAGAA